MANTYTQISIHAVFAVARRENIIVSPWRDRLHQYIAGILASETDFSLAVGGWKDHVHIFFELRKTQTISSVLKAVKQQSSVWVNAHRFIQGQFNWQDGYAAFAISRSHRDGVIKYIMNQQDHHRIKTFREEYLALLDEHEIPYEERYLFEFFD